MLPLTVPARTVRSSRLAQIAQQGTKGKTRPRGLAAVVVRLGKMCIRDRIVAMHCDNVTGTRIWPILIRSNRGISDKSALGDEGFEGVARKTSARRAVFPTPSAKGIS